MSAMSRPTAGPRLSRRAPPPHGPDEREAFRRIALLAVLALAVALFAGAFAGIVVFAGGLAALAAYAASHPRHA